jgi:hypothetical protein
MWSSGRHSERAGSTFVLAAVWFTRRIRSLALRGEDEEQRCALPAHAVSMATAYEREQHCAVPRVTNAVAVSILQPPRVVTAPA